MVVWAKENQDKYDPTDKLVLYGGVVDASSTYDLLWTQVMGDNVDTPAPAFVSNFPQVLAFYISSGWTYYVILEATLFTSKTERRNSAHRTRFKLCRVEITALAGQ